MKADTLKKSILQWAIEGKLVPQLNLQSTRLFPRSALETTSHHGVNPVVEGQPLVKKSNLLGN